ncbi:MAG: hypothetical protein IT160_06500 [Bryobacterales bacterium]|nr:hypothetical protein [Bryobacterales bacterium]
MNRREFVSLAPMALAPAQMARAAGAAGRIGFSEKDISPSIGMEQPGDYDKSYHRSFHDPCKVRAAVFDDGGKRAAVVGLDALVAPRSVVLAARRKISIVTGIAPEAILIGAAHNHSGGPLWGPMPGDFDHASPLVRRLAYDESPAADPVYVRKVEEAIAAAVIEADGRKFEGACSYGIGHEDKAAFNRRFRMKNGQSWTHPGQGNPDIVEPAGPIDPQVGVIGGWTSEGKLAGCVVNYACHATTNPGGISANWIYYLERTIRGMYGPQVVVVFTQGFSGDVTQVNNRNPYRQPAGEQWAMLVGGRVGAEAVKVLVDAIPGPVRSVEFRSRTWNAPRRAPSREHVRRSLELVQKDRRSISRADWIFAKEIVLLDAMMAREKTVEVEVQAIQVGPAAFVTGPGEMFCQLGLDLKAGSPFPFTFPTELANASAGYIPTEEAFSHSGGGYETRLSSYSNLEVTAGTRMVATGLELLKSMRPAPAPEPVPAVPFNPDPTGKGPHPWGYGDVPPELS